MKPIKYKSFQVSTTDGLRELLESSPIQGFKITTHSKQYTYFLPRLICGWKTIETLEKKEYQEGHLWTQIQEVYLENTDLINILKDYISKALRTLTHSIDELPTRVGDDVYYDKIPQFSYQVLQVILLIDNLGLVPSGVIQEYITRLNYAATMFNSLREENDAIPVRLDSEEALDKRFFYRETYNLEFF